MDPQPAVAEFSSLDRQDLRRDMEGMEKTVVEIVGLKRKRFHFEIGSGSVDLDDEAVVAPKHARSLEEERSMTTAPVACEIDLITLDSDSDDDDDCVVTGFVMPQPVTLPRSVAECSIVWALDSDDDECVIPHGAGARASRDVVQVTHDSDAVEDDDCVVTGWWSPRAALIRNSEYVNELRSASEAGAHELSDSDYSVGSFPASVSARESDDGFNNASESDVGSSASGFGNESSILEWEVDHVNCWLWMLDEGDN